MPYYDDTNAGSVFPMKTYLKWLTRLLFALTLACAVTAAIMYFSLSPAGLDGAGAIAFLYAAILGTFGFGISALAAHFIARNVNHS